LLGAFTAGFVLIPLVGMRGTIVDAMFLNLGVGLTWFAFAGWWSPGVRKTLSMATSAVFVLAAVGMIAAHTQVASGSLKPKQLQVALPEWETSVMTSAPYIDGHMALGIIKRMKRIEGQEWTTPVEEWKKYITERYKVVDYEEDVATTVTITMDGRQNLPELRVGGKVDARQWDSAQAMLAHLPLMIHPNPEDVLIVGLGSGGTLKSALLHPSVKSVQDVEISGAVVRLSEKWFERSEPFSDPRAEIIVGDGRQHVAMTDRRYDVIVSQPSNPWIVGASSLFTTDCFEQMKARLKPGGVVCIWMQGFQVGSGPVKTLLKTFSSVFDHMDLWENMSREEYFLTGYVDPLEIDPARIEARLMDAALAEERDLLYLEHAADLLGHYIGDRAALEPFYESAGISTDDHNLLEAQIPKDLLLAKSTVCAKELLAFRQSVNERVTLDPADPNAATFTEQAENIFRSHPLAVDVFIGLRDEERTRNDLLPELYKLNPNDLFSKIYRAQLDEQLFSYSNGFHGLYNNKAQALSNPEQFEDLRLAVMLIKSHTPGQAFLYFELAPAATLDKPKAQWIWRLSFDEDAKMVADVYDLPGDPSVHVSPWTQQVPLQGINPSNILERSACRIALGLTDQGLYGQTQDDKGCAPTHGIGTHGFTEVLLAPPDPANNLPRRLNLWERDVNDDGSLAGGPPGALEFVLVGNL
jgi:spermidine synthase